MGILINKVCANCGRKFITRDRNKIYCDIKCEEYARDGITVDIKELKADVRPRKEKTCLYCGRVFFQKKYEPAKAFNARKCCCASCGQRLRIQREKADR